MLFPLAPAVNSIKALSSRQFLPIQAWERTANQDVTSSKTQVFVSNPNRVSKAVPRIPAVNEPKNISSIEGGRLAMPTEDTSKSLSEVDVKKLLLELEIPFSPNQVLWRVTNASSDKKRGRVIPYADPRAYTDRLNALFTPQGWTREYKVETMSNITRVKKGESLMSGKVLVTCTVTIIGLWSHSGTGEEWADDDNGMTSADAQAFKRACSCFGLGRYFYDIAPIWVDLDQNRHPVRTPVLSAWALPENWRKGMRPASGHGDSGPKQPSRGSSYNGANGKGGGKSVSAPANGNGRNGHELPSKANGSAATNSGNGLDQEILEMEKAVGSALYRNILREYGRVNQPKLIRDTPTKRKVLQMLESATRGFGRLEAVTKRLEPKTVEALLAKLQAPPLNNIADIKTLQNVVLGLEELAGPVQPHA